VKGTLLHNLSLVDILTAPNHQVLNDYHQLILGREDEYLLYFDTYPNLISTYTVEDILTIKRNESDLIRIGIMADPSMTEDLKTIETPLKELQRRFKGKIELILYGLSERTARKLGIFKDIDITYEYPVSYTEHHHRLNNLVLDIGFIPMLDHSYNHSSRALNRWLDFAVLRIPVVMSAIPPFTQIIEDGNNGFIANDTNVWIERTEALIGDAVLRARIGYEAFRTAWGKFSYTQSALDRLRNVFLK
jgi:hypothetical protein